MRTSEGARRPVAGLDQDAGATSVEYALMASLIAVVIAFAVGTVGTALSAIFAAITAGF